MGRVQSGTVFCILTHRKRGDALENWLARHTFFVLAVFTAAYIPYVCARALLKPLWFDELYSILISQLGSVSKIVEALRSGVDAQPPLHHILIHLLVWPGANEAIVPRVPCMIGFWLMCVSVYFFVRRRGSATAALPALLLPLSSGLFYYATDARPYGLVLGFTALALLAWQSLGDNRNRIAWCSILFFSLAAGICSHYYAALVPVSLGAAEAVRARRRCVWNWSTWIALAASYLALLTIRPILTAQTDHLGVHWAKPALSSILEFYQLAMGPLLLPLMAAAIGVAIYQSVGRSSPGEPWVDEAGLPMEELAAALALALLPVLAYLLGVFVTHSYTGRYSIGALPGITVLLWWLQARFVRRGPRSSLIVVSIFAALLGLDEARTIRRALRNHDQAKLLQDDFPFRFDGDLPIVVQDARDWLQMFHYAPPELKPRLFYLTDTGKAMRFTGSVGLEPSLIDLGRWVPLQVEPYDSFTAHHREFLLFWGKPEEWALGGWDLSELQEQGARFELLEQNAMRLLFRVDLGPAPRTP